MANGKSLTKLSTPSLKRKNNGYRSKMVCMRINFNRVNRFIIHAFVCLFVFQSALAQKATVPSAREITAKVDEYMKSAVEFERFTGSILIARDGKPIVSKGYGMANIEFDAPNNPQTVFRLASLTKQFTATAIMMLQERGKLNVNDLACKYLAECPAAWQPITIRHLLTMTHGIPGISRLWRLVRFEGCQFRWINGLR